MRGARKPFAKLVAAVIGLMSCSIQAKAQVIEVFSTVAGIAGPEILRRSVKSILSEARLTANTVIAEGQRSANSLMIRGADELNVSITNADNIFANRLDKTLKDLGEPERKMLEGILAAQNTAKSLVERAYTAKDTTVLDVAGIIGSLPFTEERFTIQRIGGLTQLQKAGAYQMQVVGSYVGTTGTGPKSSLKLKIAGKEVAGLVQDPVESHRTTLSIPNDALKSHFKDGEISVVDVDLVAEYTTTKPFLLWFSSEVKQTVINRLHMALYPEFAGKAQVVTSTPTMGWKPIADDRTTQIGRDAHCESDCRGKPGIWWEFTMTVAGGERVPQIKGDIRIVDMKCEQVSPGNPFDYGLKSYISDSGRRATCGLFAHTHPQAYSMTIKREQWVPVRDEIATKPVDLYYNKVSQVAIPLEQSNIRIEGKALTGESFLQLLGVADPGSPVEILKIDENANDRTLFLRARRPTSLD